MAVSFRFRLCERDAGRRIDAAIPILSLALGTTALIDAIHSNPNIAV